MTDPGRTGLEEGSGPRFLGLLATLAVIYWLIAAAVAFIQFQGAYQAQVHRLEDLREKGLLTSVGRLDRNRIAALAADAAKNSACYDAHPPPQGQTGAWTPPECDPYLPSEADADAADAVWAANNPGSGMMAGQKAAVGALRVWALGFLPLAAVAMFVVWIIGRVASARPA
jgi:hypothetical protein